MERGSKRGKYAIRNVQSKVPLIQSNLTSVLNHIKASPPERGPEPTRCPGEARRREILDLQGLTAGAIQGETRRGSFKKTRKVLDGMDGKQHEVGTAGKGGDTSAKLRGRQQTSQCLC